MYGFITPSSLEQIKKNQEGLILVNKPIGISSFAVVARVRKVVQVAKVGHAGTLDPLASGLMIILVGRNYTKQAAMLSGLNKSYSGQVRLGLSSKTDDREGLSSEDIDRDFDNANFFVSAGHQALLCSIDHFILLLSGSYQQLPPQFSAKKVNGQRSYKKARAGHYVDVKPKLIDIDVLSYDLQGFILNFRMNVSSGTYIRSFARDLGTVTGLGGYLHSLTRDSIDNYHLSDAISWELLV